MPMWNHCSIQWLRSRSSSWSSCSKFSSGLATQLYRLHGESVILLFHLNRPDDEATCLTVHSSVCLMGSGLPVRVGSCVGRVPHLGLRVILLIFLEYYDQTHTQGVQLILMMHHDGLMLGLQPDIKIFLGHSGQLSRAKAFRMPLPQEHHDQDHVLIAVSARLVGLLFQPTESCTQSLERHFNAIQFVHVLQNVIRTCHFVCLCIDRVCILLQYVLQSFEHG